MAVKPQHQVRRMVAAAEEWGRAQLRTSVTLGRIEEPQRTPDGSLQTMIELEAAGHQPQRVWCLVTLEPDGTLVCYAPAPERNSGA